MPAEEMPLPVNDAKIEADQHDRIGTEQERQVYRLEPAVLAVMDASRIERELRASLPLDQPEPVALGDRHDLSRAALVDR